MAGWIGGGRIQRHLWSAKSIIEVTGVFVAISLTITVTNAQDDFLNLDCGYIGSNYTGPNNLTWTSDDKFIMTGNVSDNPQGDWQFREFPERRSKHCYEIPTFGFSYLIRVQFYLNVSELAERDPFEFDVSVNAQIWVTMTSGDSTSNLTVFFESQEAHFYFEDSNTTNICLLPTLGVPFISTIQVILLDPDLYWTSWPVTTQYLHVLDRYNLGNGTGPDVRHPDDRYDRIWTQIATIPEAPAVFLPTAPNTTTSADVNYVPAQVMNDGWSMDDSIYFYLNYIDNSDPRVYIKPPIYALCNLYTENLNTSDTNTYNVSVTMDEDYYASSNITYSQQPSMESWQYHILTSNSIEIGMENYTTADKVSLAPILNALEIFAQHDFNVSSTNPVDVEAISILKEALGLTDWQGDPCTPVPHDWVACNLSTEFRETNNQPCGFNSTAVTQCGVQESFLNSDYDITALFLPNLRTTDLSFFTNASNRSEYTYLAYLTQLAMPNCGINSTTFGLLIDDFFRWLSYFTILDLSYNEIADLGNLPMDLGNKVPSLTTLNLSHNIMAGMLNIFSANSSQIQELDLSYNNMTSLPTSWENSSLTNLTVLDLSHNQFTGDISALDELVIMNHGSLQKLIVSDNNLGGTFNSSLYLGLPNLMIGNFDGNSIPGTLDLTMWYNNLKANTSNSTSGQLFSFLSNDFTNIIPNSDTFDLALLQAGQATILLGGNPYCSGAKSETQRYLCRFTLAPLPQSDHHSNNATTIWVASTIGGAIALLLCCIIVFILWKLRRKVLALREIQRALADQKVQPPFFQYSDLKMATKDFHKHNRLGRGGFGIVYKGTMPDNTMLAVKTLFNSMTDQVLNEFLNEVVLITGIKHRNLVQLKGCCIQDKQRMLVYEYAEKGNLAEALWGSRPHGALNWEQRFSLCVGVARGLSYLHEELQPSIIHRDIKPENILLDANFRPKIADFGLARHLSAEETQTIYTQIAGSLGYLAPEYASEGQLSDKIDVYSYGILVLEVITGRKSIDNSCPLEEKFLKDWVFRMHKKNLLIEILQPELQNFCVEAEVIRAIKVGLLCVQHKPERRPSMSQVVTMLVGSVNVEAFVEVSERDEHELEDIFESFKDDLESSRNDSVRDNDNFSYLNRDSQSSSSNATGGTNSIPLDPSSSRSNSSPREGGSHRTISAQGSVPLIELSALNQGR